MPGATCHGILRVCSPRKSRNRHPEALNRATRVTEAEPLDGRVDMRRSSTSEADHAPDRSGNPPSGRDHR